MKPDTNSRVINLSHLKRTTGPFVVLYPPTTDLDESGSYEEEEGEYETSAPETVPRESALIHLSSSDLWVAWKDPTGGNL
jgi:hypothetical protein